MVVVEEDGARGGGVVRVGLEGLFKGLAVGLAVFWRCWQPPHGKPRKEALLVLGAFWLEYLRATEAWINGLMHLLVLGAF